MSSPLTAFDHVVAASGVQRVVAVGATQIQIADESAKVVLLVVEHAARGSLVPANSVVDRTEAGGDDALEVLHLGAVVAGLRSSIWSEV